MDITEAIQRIARQGTGNAKIQVAKVLSVDGNTCTVELLESEFEITGVRLQVETQNGVLYVPAVDSFVIIAPIDDFEYFVVMYSALASIKMLDGSYGGLIKIEDLVTKLNNLENKVNSIINTFNTHVHGGVTTGAGSSAVSPTPVSGTLTPTVRANIENDKIIHGAP